MRNGTEMQETGEKAARAELKNTFSKKWRRRRFLPEAEAARRPAPQTRQRPGAASAPARPPHGLRSPQPHRASSAGNWAPPAEFQNFRLSIKMEVYL